MRYDALRSPQSDDFDVSTVCLESDVSVTAAEDPHEPAPGEHDSFLIRVENDCPGVAGSLGSDSAGTPRSGVACP